MTPTPEQIARDIVNITKIYRMSEEKLVAAIATALATARLEERNKTLDEARDAVFKIWTPYSPPRFRQVAEAILALKHKDSADEHQATSH